MMDVVEGLGAFFLRVVTAFFQRDAYRVFVDVLDILLVSYLFYRVLLLLRGTRAMQMGVGLVLVFMVYGLARRVGLITTFTLLDGLLTYIVLIIVVLFQNDIRRALMRVGSRPFFRRGQSARESEVITEVVEAAQALAQKRIGALFVFERDASLDEFIEHGPTLDAEVSRELLYSIFVPSYENPMHDGAVLIREGRLYQAGAFLPLTDSTKVDRTLGTRHRAAIGISEETDCVVLVVSEERGAVSLCFDGNIIRDLDPSLLQQTIVGLFAKRASRAKPRRSRFPLSGRPSGPPGNLDEANVSEKLEGAQASEATPESEGSEAPGLEPTGFEPEERQP